MVLLPRLLAGLSGNRYDIPAFSCDGNRFNNCWDYVGLKFDEEFIKDIDMFQNMKVREAKMASLMAYTVDMEPGKQLFSQGDIGDEMYVVLDGSISIFLEKGESVQTLCD
ncbi:MAG: hypothetical protein Ct9H300mP28_23450 [Pseudomonadota bacterium]|nr:MAG: hypothetical protein Ct9H300mP28_23450 [Pseudomonadota bacterium]